MIFLIILIASASKQEEEAIQPFCLGFIRKPIQYCQLVAELKKIFPPLVTVFPEWLEESENLEKEWENAIKTHIFR